MTAGMKKIVCLFWAFAFTITLIKLGPLNVNASETRIVTNETELREAIADHAVATIVIESGVTVYIEATIVINRPLHLTGGGTLAVRQDGQRVIAWVPASHPLHLLVETAYFDTSLWANTGANVPTAGQVWLPRGGQTGAMLRIETGDVTISSITLTGLATTTSHNHITGIYVTNAGPNRVRLENLIIENMNHGAPDGIMTPMGGFGIQARNSNVDIVNNQITRFNNQGISLVGGNVLAQGNVIIGMPDNNDFRAKAGIQVWGTIATLIGNSLEHFRFNGSDPGVGILVFDGAVTAAGNIFRDIDIAVIASGAVASPVVTLSDSNFDDGGLTRLTDLFVRVENAAAGHANVTNYDAIWADRIAFPWGGGWYNGALVTTSGTAATQKITQWENWHSYPIPDLRTAPAPNAAIVTFYYPVTYQPRPSDPRGMLSLQLPNIAGTRVSSDRLREQGGLIVWAGADGYIRGTLNEFPIATLPGYTITGWRDWPYNNGAPVVLDDPLLVYQPRTIVPVLLPPAPIYHTVTFIIMEDGVAVRTTSVTVRHGETIPPESIPSSEAPTCWEFVEWLANIPTDTTVITEDTTFTATFRYICDTGSNNNNNSGNENDENVDDDKELEDEEETPTSSGRLPQTGAVAGSISILALSGFALAVRLIMAKKKKDNIQ